MIVGLGIDLVELDRVERILGRWGKTFLSRIMSDAEAAALPAVSPEAVAASVAVKEAASKAIGTGWSRGVRWRDVVVDHRPSGPPAARLEARALLTARRLGSTGATEVHIDRRAGLVIATVRLLA